MVAKIIDGKTIAAEIRAEIAGEITATIKQGSRQPGLAVILVGEDPASTIYVQNKRQACDEVGIKSIFHHLAADISENKLIELINELNDDRSMDGILLQLPLPAHLNDKKILELIAPHKDVDGFHPWNFGRLAQGNPFLQPCTPLGIMALLDHTGEIYKNRHSVIIGASNIVGRPIALELLLAGSTITICHHHTQDLSGYVQQADIVVSAVGIPNLIKGEWIKLGATVIDVGMNRLTDGTITGDVEFEIAKQRAAWITPVPGGVGPMTVAMLLKNTLFAWKNLGAEPAQDLKQALC